MPKSSIIFSTYVLMMFFLGAALAELDAPLLVSPVRVISPELGPRPLTVYSYTSSQFIVCGKASDANAAGIMEWPIWPPVYFMAEVLPNLEVFFKSGGTLELVTPVEVPWFGDNFLVISEIMWGVDTNYPGGAHTNTQWIEIFKNDSLHDLLPNLELHFLFTPSENHPNRDFVHYDSERYFVLDAVSNLNGGRWDLPGQSGRRPSINIVSAYRDIPDLILYASPLGTWGWHERASVPFGSDPTSWKASPENWRWNVDRTLPYFATPGAPVLEDPKTAVSGSSKLTIQWGKLKKGYD